MHPWLKRAIGAAGIAVGFLLWQGSPAGASELVNDPLASTAKSGKPAGVAAVGDLVGQALSGNLGGVNASASIQATTGRSENSGNSGDAAVESKVTFGDSKAHIAVNGPEGKVKGLPKATCELACTQLIEDHVRVLDVLRDAADDAATQASNKLGEVPCELEPGDVARRAKQVLARAKNLAHEARKGRELTIAFKASGHARLRACDVVDLKARVDVQVRLHQHIGLKYLDRAAKHTTKSAAAAEKCLHGTLDDRFKKARRHRC